MPQSEPLTWTVWRALPDHPIRAMALAKIIGEQTVRVDTALSWMARSGRVVHTEDGYVRGDRPPKRGSHNYANSATPRQMRALERCCCVYGATMTDLGNLLGLTPKRTTFVVQNLRRRELVEMERVRAGVKARYRTTDRGYELLERLKAEACS